MKSIFSQEEIDTMIKAVGAAGGDDMRWSTT